MRKLRIGFVGVGGMGQMAHLSNYSVLAALGECELAALAEPRTELANMVAHRYGVPSVYRDHTELLEAGNVDAIVAPQPYRRHSIIVPDILRAGIPVFTEKPLTLSVEAGETLVKMGEDLQVLHMVGYHKRSDPASQYAKAVVDEWKASQEYGRLRYIRVSMPPGDWVAGADGPLMTDEPVPQAELEPMPIGMDESTAQAYDLFVNYYIHQVNLIRHFLGEEYRLRYAAPSGVLLVGESKSGVCVTLEMAAYSTTLEWHEQVLVAFEKGYVNVNLPAPLARQRAGEVTVMRDNGNRAPVTERPHMPNRSAMRQQASNFIAAVRGEKPAPCVAKEAFEDLKIARDYIHMVRG